MCLAVPMEVTRIDGKKALVSVGGTKREIRLDIVDERPKLGDYVIVHAGFAIRRIDEQEAQETLDMFRKMVAYETR